jgi:2-polyprenyl-3-methyl-5-hydroxy-6-metoxy-1,4-benzoquinol methylase
VFWIPALQEGRQNRLLCTLLSTVCSDLQTTDLSTFKDLVTQKFDARTEHDKNNNHQPKVAAELVARAKLRQGWDVLDLACGTGLVTYLAAADVGPNGSVEAMDLSPFIQTAFYDETEWHEELFAGSYW